MSNESKGGATPVGAQHSGEDTLHKIANLADARRREAMWREADPMRRCFVCNGSGESPRDAGVVCPNCQQERACTPKSTNHSEVVQIEAVSLPLADAQMLLAWMDETFGDVEGTDWMDEDAAAVGDALNKAIENFKRLSAVLSAAINPNGELNAIDGAESTLLATDGAAQRPPCEDCGLHWCGATCGRFLEPGFVLEPVTLLIDPANWPAWADKANQEAQEIEQERTHATAVKAPSEGTSE